MRKIKWNWEENIGKAKEIMDQIKRKIRGNTHGNSHYSHPTKWKISAKAKGIYRENQNDNDEELSEKDEDNDIENDDDQDIDIEIEDDRGDHQSELPEEDGECKKHPVTAFPSPMIPNKIKNKNNSHGHHRHRYPYNPHDQNEHDNIVTDNNHNEIHTFTPSDLNDQKDPYTFPIPLLNSIGPSFPFPFSPSSLFNNFPLSFLSSQIQQMAQTVSPTLVTSTARTISFLANQMGNGKELKLLEVSPKSPSR